MESTKRSNAFRDKFRFLILVLGTMCLSSVLSNMLTINVTLICMDPEKDVNTSSTMMINTWPPRHAYTQYEKTLLQWAVAVASLFATFPFSWACTRYGARWTFFASGIASALATAAIPAAAALSFNAFLIVRVVQGAAYACDFAVIGVLCTRWASLRENAKFIGLLTCFTPIASVFTSLVAGFLCDSPLGWPSVHYAHAFLALALFAAWALLYTDDPRENARVSARELAFIHHGKSDAHKKRNAFVPYIVKLKPFFYAILRSKVVWAVWLNAFVDLTCALFLIIYLPAYFNKVMLLDMAQIGTLGAFVYGMNVPLKMFAGYISDAFHCMPERQKMWAFNSVALLVPAGVYMALCFVPAGETALLVGLFAAIIGSIGFNAGGFYKCGALAARQYAEFVIASTQFIKCTVFFVAPALVAIFVHDQTNAAQWHMIFYIMAASLVLANVMFCVYATDEPCGFTLITADLKKLKTTQSL